MAKDLTQAELIEDFKQFVAAEITNAIAFSEKSVTHNITSKIDDLRTEMHDGFAAIADIFERHQNQLDRHEKDIAVLKAR